MHTHLTASPEEAASFLRRGQPVAFPTETVFGVGVDAFDPTAVRRVFDLKGRPEDNPLIVHVGDFEQIAAVVRPGGASADALIERFFPGPLTLVLQKQASVPAIVTAGLETVAVRMPSPRLTREFLRLCRTPVAAPSANLSGRPSPTTWQDVLSDFDGRIPCILQGPQSSLGLESTVVDCTTEPPVVLRAGSISIESLREVVPETTVPEGSARLLLRSPGTRHRHYAPNARVHIIQGPDDAHPDRMAGYIGITPPNDDLEFGAVRVCTDLPQYAFELYHFFRTCDRMGLSTIYCQRVEAMGLGSALMDRLTRASAGSNKG